MVRVFERWNDAFPDQHHDYLKAQGYPLSLSVRAMLTDGTPPSWAEMAPPSPAAALHATMTRWARAGEGRWAPVLFSFTRNPS